MESSAWKRTIPQCFEIIEGYSVHIQDHELGPLFKPFYFPITIIMTRGIYRLGVGWGCLVMEGAIYMLETSGRF